MDGASAVYYLERLRAVDNQPVFWERLVFPQQSLPNFDGLSFENQSLFQLLSDHYQIQVKGGEQKVWAVSAVSEISDKLGVTPGSPVLRLDKRIDTNRLDFSFYSSLYARTDAYVLHGRF
jgi:DNA-binding GntR family transcriptional regulator